MLLLAFLTGCFLQSAEAPPAQPDLLVLADVGVVVVDGRIDAVYTNLAEAQARAGEGTAILRGERVTAGFVDAHAHPVAYGRQLAELDLVGIDSYAETLARVGAAGPGEGWLWGRGWDQNDWADAPEGTWPTAADLDVTVADRPVALRRIDGHAVWLNSAALKAAGITADTTDPKGGKIVRGPDGAPSGVLIDNAMELLPSLEPSRVDIRRWVVDGVTAFASTGLTGAHVMGIDDTTLQVLEYLDRKGTMPIRLWVYVNPDSEAAKRLASEGGWGHDKVKVVGIKAYADGALGSRGALLSAPYADQPQTSGLALTSPEDLVELAKRYTPMGVPVAVHGIGDLGVRNALDAFAAAQEANPGAEVRHRVEHAQVVHPDDLLRFSELGVVASVQPTHATSDHPWVLARLGEERVAWSYAWRSMLDAGARITFGSDAPVESPAPALGLASAVERDGWRIEEAVKLEEAIAAFTSGAAYAVREEERLGSLEPGMLADLTLWTTSEAGAQVPTATVVEGNVLWRDPKR